MQAGFAFLEAGGVNAKNTVNVLYRNLFDSSIVGNIASLAHLRHCQKSPTTYIGRNGILLDRVCFFVRLISY